MLDHCESITDDGAAVCVPGACICSSEPQNNAPILLSLPSVNEHKSTFKQFVTELKKAISFNHIEGKSHVEENS
jgi:hypothetical protein